MGFQTPSPSVTDARKQEKIELYNIVLTVRDARKQEKIELYNIVLISLVLNFCNELRWYIKQYRLKEASILIYFS